jgi:hypothetical protein
VPRVAAASQQPPVRRWPRLVESGGYGTHSPRGGGLLDNDGNAGSSVRWGGMRRQNSPVQWCLASEPGEEGH